MTARRKHRLADCNPQWVTSNGATCGVRFECPEGHSDCVHVIPFTPSLEGAPVPSWYASGAKWERTGDTLEALTLSPSIRRPPQQYASREAALAAGVLPEHFDESLTCAVHIFVRAGSIEFCGDSR